MSFPRYRTVVHNPRFTEELDVLKPDTKRSEEFVLGVELVLCKDPTVGTCIGGDLNVWCLSTKNVVSLDPLIVYYAFDHNQVWLLSIQRTVGP